MRRVGLVVSFQFALLSAGGAAASGPWTVDRVDSVDYCGDFAMMAVGASGRLQICYLDWTGPTLRYATKAGGIWSRETVQGSAGLGQHNAIAVDGLDTPHVVTWDSGPGGNLVYAHKSGGVWAVEIADGSANNVGTYTSIAVDAANNPHVSYTDLTLNDLWYGRRAGGAWILESVDSSSHVGSTTIAVDAQGNPMIGYFVALSGDLKYARKSGGVWSIENVDTSGDTGWGPSIDIDSQGNPHLSYMDNDTRMLRYARRAGGVWTRETVESSNMWPGTSLQLDGGDQPHIAFGDLSNIIRYSRKSGGAWSTETADSAQHRLQSPSLALGPGGVEHLAYQDDNNGDLMYAVRAGHTGVGAAMPEFAHLSVIPNPSAAGRTVIHCRIPSGPAAGPSDLAVFDVTGRRIRTLASGPSADGTQSVAWDGRDDSGRQVAAGVYILNLTSGTGQAVSERVTLIR